MADTVGNQRRRWLSAGAGAQKRDPRCRQCRTGTGVPALGRALRAPVQASAGLRPGTPCPVPAFGRHSVPQCRPVFSRHSVPL